MEDKKQKSSEIKKNDNDTKYIHITEITSPKLDEDDDYQNSKSEDTNLTEKEKNQENETMGIP
jgi:hypothetical protein